MSISSHKLEHADGSNTDEPFPDDEKFRLLLVAESEMGSKAEVLRDFLKLTCIECPIKVMVYKAVEQGEREAMKDAFLNVIANARREQDGAEWLLVGIPGYKQWLDSYGDPAGLTRSVHVLSPAGDEFLDRDDLWHWNDG